MLSSQCSDAPALLHLSTHANQQNGNKVQQHETTTHQPLPVQKCLSTTSLPAYNLSSPQELFYARITINFKIITATVQLQEAMEYKLVVSSVLGTVNWINPLLQWNNVQFITMWSRRIRKENYFPDSLELNKIGHCYDLHYSYSEILMRLETTLGALGITYHAKRSITKSKKFGQRFSCMLQDQLQKIY